MKVIFPKQSQGISRGTTRLGPWWRDRRRRYRGPGGNPCCIFLHGGGMYIGGIHCSIGPMPSTFRPSPCSGCSRYGRCKVKFTYIFLYFILSCTLKSLMLKTYSIFFYRFMHLYIFGFVLHIISNCVFTNLYALLHILVYCDIAIQ